MVGRAHPKMIHRVANVSFTPLLRCTSPIATAMLDFGASPIRSNVFFTGTDTYFSQVSVFHSKEPCTDPRRSSYFRLGPAMAGIGSSSRKNSKEETSMRWTSL